eukprot:gene22342-29431_t
MAVTVSLSEFRDSGFYAGTPPGKRPKGIKIIIRSPCHTRSSVKGSSEKERWEALKAVAAWECGGGDPVQWLSTHMYRCHKGHMYMIANCGNAEQVSYVLQMYRCQKGHMYMIANCGNADQMFPCHKGHMYMIANCDNADQVSSVFLMYRCHRGHMCMIANCCYAERVNSVLQMYRCRKGHVYMIANCGNADQTRIEARKTRMKSTRDIANHQWPQGPLLNESPRGHSGGSPVF